MVVIKWPREDLWFALVSATLLLDRALLNNSIASVFDCIRISWISVRNFEKLNIIINKQIKHVLLG